jgi:hypothetical protein
MKISPEAVNRIDISKWISKWQHQQ